MGLVGAVLDTRFRTLATPYLVAWIYRGCMALIGLSTVFFVLLSAWVATLRNGWLWGLCGVLAAPVVGAVLLLCARVACEFVLLRFQRTAPPAPGLSVDPAPRAPRG
jgi:hypothetical protein